jgi:hypothetical protein
MTIALPMAAVDSIDCMDGAEGEILTEEFPTTPQSQ